MLQEVSTYDILLGLGHNIPHWDWLFRESLAFHKLLQEFLQNALSFLDSVPLVLSQDKL